MHINSPFSGRRSSIGRIARRKMESDTERENNPDVGDFPTQRTEHSIARQRRRFSHVQGFCRGQKRKIQGVRAKRGDLIFDKLHIGL